MRRRRAHGWSDRGSHGRFGAIALVLAVVGALGCAEGGAEGARPALRRAAPGAAPTVILISMDGTRPADLRPDRLPSLVALGRAGLRAGALIPVNPSNTFPNHVSLATGARPDVHRLVNNSFVDPVRGRFKRSAPHAWIEAEPIWSVAERHGVTSASFYWVGSEGPWSGGPGPTHWKKFSSRTRERTKVDQILAWLDEPDPARRPHLITAWFHGADHEGHDHGPESRQVTAALASQDREIARLVAGLEARALFETTTLVFVSDHGMATADRRVDLRRVLSDADLSPRVLGIGGFATVYFSKGRATRARVDQAVAAAREAGLSAWPRAEAPAAWHVDDVRFGDVVVRAPIGTAIVTPTSLIDGFHGYDPEAPEMAAMLVARGRGVPPGTRIGRVSNLRIAPTVLALLGLPAPETMRAPPIEAMLQGIDARDGAPPAPGEAERAQGAALSAQGVAEE